MRNEETSRFIKRATLLLDKEEEEMEIQEVLSKQNKDGTTGYRALAFTEDDPDYIVCIRENIPEKPEYEIISGWAYNIDEYLFDNLEKGYEIKWMSLEHHYDLWCELNECYEDIHHAEGFRKYASHCKISGITAEEIAALGLDRVDIFHLVHEEDASYEKISEIKFKKCSVILGYNGELDASYATWITSSGKGNRKARYFCDFQEGFRDYKGRCKTMLLKDLESERSRIRPHNVMDHTDR